MGLLKNTIDLIPSLDKRAMDDARRRQDVLTKPHGSLGRLEELSIKLAGITGNTIPQIRDKAIITMAADHGIVDEGISAYPREVTPQMVYNFVGGGAAVNVLARQIGARVIVVDMGVAAELQSAPHLISRKVAFGTQNMASGPAMTMEQATEAVEAGIDVIMAEVSKGLDIVGTGDMGIGNTTASSAIYATIMGQSVANVTGKGTGLDEGQLPHKIAVIEKVLAVNKPDPTQPLDVLAKVGGFEIAGLVGVMLGAAAHRVPVVIDGFISGAAAVIAAALAPKLKDLLIASHVSAEQGHHLMLQHLGLSPLLDLNMRLGEGTGAVLGIFLTESASKILAEMSTFEEAGVSERTDSNS